VRKLIGGGTQAEVSIVRATTQLDEPSTGATRAARSGRLPFLDSVRALAAVYVVIHHLYLAVYPGFPTNTGPAPLALVMYGQFGVAVFIVVSGFSLALGPVRRGYEMGSGYGEFIRRRAWRIIPPYWAALAFSVAIVGLIVNQRMDHPLGLRGVLTHLLLVQDVVEGESPNGAFWSIAIEWQLYFVFPLFLLIRRRAGAAALCALAVVAAVALLLAEGRVPGVDKLMHLSPQFAALFVFGIVAAAVTRRSAEQGPSSTRWWGALALAAAAVVFGACVGLGTERSMDNLYALDLVVGVATAAALAFLAGGPGGRLRRALEVGPLVSVGHYSYSLYLIHAPLLLVAWLYVVKPLDLGTGGSFAVMVFAVGPLILLTSYGFHRCVERPFLEHRSLRSLYASRSRRQMDEELGDFSPERVVATVHE
jgi:peptidoglycan/LPS O-acetylase OafA/YrhL